MFDLFEAVAGRQAVTWQARLLTNQPTVPYDHNTFGEPTWTSYRPSLVTDIEHDELPDLGMALMKGKVQFTYNGPNTSAQAWGVYLLATLDGHTYLADVIRFNRPQDGTLNIGTWVFDAEVMAKKRVA